MAAERFFTKVAQDVLDATERLANHLDDNINLFWGSTSSGGGSSSSENDGSRSTENDFHILDDIDSEDHTSSVMDDTDDASNYNPLQGMADQVLSGIMDGQIRPQTPLESFHAFRSAITWTEPFIIGILIFHCIMFVLTLYVSRYNSNLAPRLTMMIVIAILVRTSEYINVYGSQHWKEFGITQNYFDPKGFFMTIMICSPLLFYSFIMLCFFLKEASTLLIQVKKVQLQKQHRQKQQKGTTTTNAAKSSSGMKKVQ